MERLVHFIDLGLISYKEAFEIQTLEQKKLINRKLDVRDGKLIVEKGIINKLLFCEHLPVYTLGRSGSMDNLLFNEIDLRKKNIEFHKTNRGGDITFHGHGQIVGYPIFDLDIFFHDVHKYVRLLEEAIIKTLNYFGIYSSRIDGLTGVWIKGNESEKDRRICAIGVHMSRWVTLHGFAFNVNTDLDFFKGIIPCGISDNNKEVTSMKEELGVEIDLVLVKEKLKKSLEEVFDFKYV